MNLSVTSEVSQDSVITTISAKLPVTEPHISSILLTIDLALLKNNFGHVISDLVLEANKSVIIGQIRRAKKAKQPCGANNMQSNLLLHVNHARIRHQITTGFSTMFTRGLIAKKMNGRGLKISHLPSKLRFSAKCSFFGQSLSRGHYQPTYQPPDGVYLLINEVVGHK